MTAINWCNIKPTWVKEGMPLTTFIVYWMREYPDSPMDGFTAVLNYEYIMGIRVDWHKASYSLDELHTMGVIEHVGFTADGMDVYKWKKEN